MMLLDIHTLTRFNLETTIFSLMIIAIRTKLALHCLAMFMIQMDWMSLLDLHICHKLPVPIYILLA